MVTIYISHCVINAVSFEHPTRKGSESYLFANLNPASSVKRYHFLGFKSAASLFPLSWVNFLSLSDSVSFLYDKQGSFPTDKVSQIQLQIMSLFKWYHTCSLSKQDGARDTTYASSIPLLSIRLESFLTKNLNKRGLTFFYFLLRCVISWENSVYPRNKLNTVKILVFSFASGSLLVFTSNSVTLIGSFWNTPLFLLSRLNLTETKFVLQTNTINTTEENA